MQLDLGIATVIASTIAAFAAVRNGRRAKQIHREVESPNGTTTGQAVQDLKAFAEEHELRDIERFLAVHKRIDQLEGK